MTLLEGLIVALVAAALLPTLLFVIAYAGMAPWSRSATGRRVMATTANVGLFLVYALTSRVLGDYSGRQVLGVVLYLWLGAVQWWQFVTLIRQQREARRAPSDD